MRLRDATQADVGAIAHLHWSGWEKAYRGLLTDALLDGTTLAMRAAQWPGWFETKRAGLIVADEAGDLVGFVCAVAAREIAALGAASEIQLLYVRADRQGAGLGAALLRAGAARAAALWPGTMGLWVVRGHARARGFYQRMGGRLGPERREWLRGEPIDEVAYLWDAPAALGACPEAGQAG
jgi:GNAT superfamily N-acetyltransferase